MSYYENNPQQWSSPGQNNWEHQAPPASRGDVARTLTARPTELDRFENVSKNNKSYGMSGRREYPSPGPKMGGGPGGGRKSVDYNGRMSAGPGSRPHSVNQFDDARNHPNSNLQNFYATQRQQSSRGSNEAEQMMQAKRRMAAQRERELRNLHTEQQYQRNVLTDVNYNGNSNGATPAPATPNKQMSEEETRELIARQRSALYGEGPFAEKAGYIDETGIVRTGNPGHSGPPSLRGASPMGYEGGAGPFRGGLAGPSDAASLRGQSPMAQELRGNPPPHSDVHSAASAADAAAHEQASRTGSTASPQPNTSNKNAFDTAVSQAAARTTNSSPGGSSSPRQEAPNGSKPSQQSASVAPIGTRPSAAPAAGSAASKRSTTPLASPGGWGRGNGVWGPQSSGLGATSASVWG
ncbi:conserved hypothetical protein [Verticillium alfalfae VaMs.102]|uniref:Uncharacterized protein n=1 Tax=Verticillium alfalfae (strain VaMs.102 / ATCC MYA-4576 / FGSC 10136) TaxID=526221 RepID=C9S9Q2_VERA1|nr:conserved hypothetical protein [Verticillium alfalfae VaMs.102]EEY16115.1 conserved hypothetical protein [Verticillium alfalfae VaMs.102]